YISLYKISLNELKTIKKYIVNNFYKEFIISNKILFISFIFITAELGEKL
ncbi:hypothetical protein BO78DRAFT_305410, partial [Aspergillus sclerotiicarbonarius CBS 121057]